MKRITKSSDSAHFNDLSSPRAIEINGKTYVKVQLRFVDTLNTDASKFLLKLEKENEQLKKDVQRLALTCNRNAELQKSIEMLNANLLNEVKRVEAKTKNEIISYKEQVKKQNAIIISLYAELKAKTEQLQLKRQEVVQQNEVIMLKTLEVHELSEQLQSFMDAAYTDCNEANLR